MRDYSHNGDIYGSVTITDNSVNHKPLAQCTNPELHNERTFREKQTNKEIAEIVRRALLWGTPLGLLAALVYILMTITTGQSPHPAIITALLAAGPFAAGGIRYKEREGILKRHGDALQEIKTLLGERGQE